MSNTKTFVYVNRKAPYGSVYALESLEVVLIGAAFEQDVKLVFMDDGVFQLTKGQDPEGIGMKNFSKTYAALGDYDISQIYVDEISLNERGLTLDDLQPLVYEDEDDDWEEKSSIHLVSRDQLSDVIESADVLLNF
ncbi:MAG: sulfurtransferase complex subunit TusC [Gammaproteobacteria bacterium]|nr:sulfurtransferase complex subunit TusC [Gammaproteobacteria bacterium]